MVRLDFEAEKILRQKKLAAVIKFWSDVEFVVQWWQQLVHSLLALYVRKRPRQSICMDLGTQELRGPGLNKRLWTEEEDAKLIKALMDLHNTGKYIADGGFKPGLFSAVEKILAITLPNAGLKADPHIKSRMKTLKIHFGIVRDILYGPNTNGFGYDDTKKCVVAEKEVWDIYLRSHKKAAPLKDKPFPFYRELCIIFGKDHATCKDAETSANVVEELDREQTPTSANVIEELDREQTLTGNDNELNNVGDGLNAIEVSMSHEQSPTVGNTSEASSSKKKRKKRGILKKRGQNAENKMYAVIERSTSVMISTMEETANRLSRAIGDATINELKLQLNNELLKLGGLSVVERHRATIKIGCDRDLTQIFFTIGDEEKEQWVRSVIM